ncbi:MAG: beta-L-arabinofuranosidase domain-containing protein [Armatimonadota bacterium]
MHHKLYNCQSAGILAILMVMCVMLSPQANAGVPAQKNRDKEMSAITKMHITGPLGQRIEANLNQWLLPAPDANPSMVEMFNVRDRSQPYPNPLAWSGEFFGKYLISAVQALRMTESKQLKQNIEQMVARFISLQSEEGYMGPFPKAQRLRTGWDVWGHYHCMLGLYQWYRYSGDKAALASAIKAADFICDTFLNGDLRIYDTGSLEMNMGVVHIMGILHRETGNPRYLQLMRQIEEDWRKPEAGDYLEQALAGKDFYNTPKPRWESLPILQGIGEFYRITGDEKYRTALLHDWYSIHMTDVHNSGSFSAGEQAVGNPYVPMAIETCCTVAWMALSIDALKFSSDSRIADALENATYNAMMGAQSPSGRWWTYDTPMNGRREAATTNIYWQSRPGSPEFNCCSANGPRSLGMLSEWSVMANEQGLAINSYAPGQINAKDAQGHKWKIELKGEYPVELASEITFKPESSLEACVRFRIPGWSIKTQVKLNGKSLAIPEAGEYLAITRKWKSGDKVSIQFDDTLRVLRADQRQQNNGCIYRGPLLLAIDQHDNPYDPDQMKALDAEKLEYKLLKPQAPLAPMCSLQFKDVEGQNVVLRDFASAGNLGTTYRSWMPMVNTAPAAFLLEYPAYGAVVAPGRLSFRWGDAGDECSYKFELADNSLMKDPLVVKDGLTTFSVACDDVQSEKSLYWQVTAVNSKGKQLCINGPWKLSLDASMKPDEEGAVARAAMHGDAKVELGALVQAVAIAPTPNHAGVENAAIGFNGGSSKIQIKPTVMPLRDYTASLWVKPLYADPKNTDGRMIISAWRLPMDDPMRLVMIGNQIMGAIENGANYMTPGIPVVHGKWIHVTLVKKGAELAVYVDGKKKQKVACPEELISYADDLAIGANPHFAIGQNSWCEVSDFVLYARALSDDEIKQLVK